MVQAVAQKWIAAGQNAADAVRAAAMAAKLLGQDEAEADEAAKVTAASAAGLHAMAAEDGN